MYELGAIIGGLVPTFLIRGLFLLIIPKDLESPGLRYFVANIVSFIASMTLYAFGSADGGPPNWGGGFLFLIPQSVWLIVDLARLQSRVAAQSTTTATQQVATSSSLAPTGPAPAPRSANEAAAPPPALHQAAAAKEPSQGELVFWQSIKDSKDPADFASYLSQFPAGFFRQLARNRLVALGGTVPPPDARATPASIEPVTTPADTEVRSVKPTVGRWPMTVLVLTALVGAVVVLAWFSSQQAERADPFPTSVAIVAPQGPEEESAEALSAARELSARQARGAKTFTAQLERDMVSVAGGTFNMGSPVSEAERSYDEGPQRAVTVAPFELSRFEVTFAQWDACVAAGACDGYAPQDSFDDRENVPVSRVSWDDAQSFIAWLNLSRADRPYRLPTESEWEYAARAGSNTKYWWGNRASHEYANYGNEDNFMGQKAGRDQWIDAAPVGSFRPNPFGLYDMNGNLWEWVQDCYEYDYSSAPQNGRANETGGCQSRVARGGAYNRGAGLIRSANREEFKPSERIPVTGFRIARTIK